MRGIVLAVALTLAATPGFAQGGDTKGNGAPKGKFEKFLLVAPGNPKTVQDDYTNFLKNDWGNGRAIFIPVKTTNGPDPLLCDAADGTGSWIIGDEANNNLYVDYVVQGVKINFVKNPALTSMDIADRDATDGYAEIQVPQDWENATSIDLWIRVLGKPGGCISAKAMVYDGSYYFYAGTATFKRKAGQSTFVDAGELTDVFYCPEGYTVVPTGNNAYDCAKVVDGTTVYTDAIEYQVFDSVFSEYFWDVTNDGVRVMQVLMRANF